MPAPPQPTLPVLALDTSTEIIAAGLHTGRDAFTVLAPGGALASAQLIPQLQALLGRAGLAWADLGAIAFGQGPGAFTGLRTACAVAQGLAYGLQLPLLPIDSLLVVAEDARWQAADAEQDVDIGVALDARMNEAYAARYRWQGGCWQTLQAPALFSLAALAEAWARVQQQTLAGSALAAFGDRLVLPAAWPRVEREHDRAAALLRLAQAAVLAGEGLDPALALPLYLRDQVALTTAERAAVKARAADLASIDHAA